MLLFFFFKQKTAYEMRISDWSSDVCSSDLTGLNAPAGFDVAIAEELSKSTGIAFEPASNTFEAPASHDGLVLFSGALTTLGVALPKIANAIRLLGSGPRAGLGELALPANEPGSSLMQRTANPTQRRMTTMDEA